MPRPSGKRRPSEGHLSFQRFIDLQRRSSQVPPLPVRQVEIRVLVATCSGADALSKISHRRLTLVRATTDPAAELRELAASSYGSLVLPARGAEFEIEPGWDDWEEVALTHTMLSGLPCLDGIRLDGGALRISIGGAATFAAFRQALQDGLGTRRYDEMLLQPQALDFRRTHGLPLDVRPRYVSAHGARIRDLVALDPSSELPMLVLRAAAALSMLMAFPEKRPEASDG